MTTTFPVKFGKYLLLERISAGGMAEVFRAKAFGVAGFEKRFAIKKILPTISEDPEFVAMFIDEAKIASRLHHANICQIVEFGRVGRSYFQAMEYIPGCDLRNIRKTLKAQARLVPPEVILHVIERVCDGLDYAHRKTDISGQPLGIVHRDISPQNILVSYEGAVKLIDFGIAKAKNRVAKTQAGQIKGKFAYLSPEQIMGQPIDGRTDIFALGTVLWELLAGRELFTGENEMDILRKIIRAEIPPLAQVNPTLPRELNALVMQALALSPEDRFETAADFMEEIQRLTFKLNMRLDTGDVHRFMATEFAQDIAKEEAKVRRYWDLSHEMRLPETTDEIDQGGKPQTIITFSGRRLMPRPKEDGEFDDSEVTVIQGVSSDSQTIEPQPENDWAEDFGSLDSADFREVSSHDETEPASIDDVMELADDDLVEVVDEPPDDAEYDWKTAPDPSTWQDWDDKDSLPIQRAERPSDYGQPLESTDEVIEDDPVSDPDEWEDEGPSSQWEADSQKWVANSRKAALDNEPWDDEATSTPEAIWEDDTTHIDQPAEDAPSQDMDWEDSEWDAPGTKPGSTDFQSWQGQEATDPNQPPAGTQSPKGDAGPVQPSRDSRLTPKELEIAEKDIEEITIDEEQRKENAPGQPSGDWSLEFDKEPSDPSQK